MDSESTLTMKPLFFLAAALLTQTVSPIRPDATLTPGATLDVTSADFCVSGYTARVRKVSAKTKREVYAEYHITPTRGAYEVDHLIPLELGGSNAIGNLWPEAIGGSEWDAHRKNKLENRLHKLVCGGQADMATTQREIASDWIAAYRKYFPNG